MWKYIVCMAAFLAPSRQGFSPLECAPSFGHFLGNAEEDDRGCCISELEDRRCNQVNVNKENVKRQLTHMRKTAYDLNGTDCPHSEPVFSAPIFGLSAWSSELYAIDQRDDALQIVRQSFCREECCTRQGACQQVYDSVEMNVKDSVTMMIVRRKIFVGVGCDYGNGPPQKRIRRSDEASGDPITPGPDSSASSKAQVTLVASEQTSTIISPVLNHTSTERTSALNPEVSTPAVTEQTSSNISIEPPSNQTTAIAPNSSSENLSVSNQMTLLTPNTSSEASTNISSTSDQTATMTSSSFSGPSTSIIPVPDHTPRSDPDVSTLAAAKQTSSSFLVGSTSNQTTSVTLNSSSEVSANISDHSSSVPAPTSDPGVATERISSSSLVNNTSGPTTAATPIGSTRIAENLTRSGNSTVAASAEMPTTAFPTLNITTGPASTSAEGRTSTETPGTSKSADTTTPSFLRSSSESTNLSTVSLTPKVPPTSNSSVTGSANTSGIPLTSSTLTLPHSTASPLGSAEAKSNVSTSTLPSSSTTVSVVSTTFTTFPSTLGDKVDSIPKPTSPPNFDGKTETQNSSANNPPTVASGQTTPKSLNSSDNLTNNNSKPPGDSWTTTPVHSSTSSTVSSTTKGSGGYLTTTATSTPSKLYNSTTKSDHLIPEVTSPTTTSSSTQATQNYPGSQTSSVVTKELDKGTNEEVHQTTKSGKSNSENQEYDYEFNNFQGSESEKMERVDQSVPIQPLSLSFGPKVSTTPKQTSQVSGSWQKETSIPIGYLQRPGVGIEDPVNHNKDMDAINLNTAPQYKQKRNRGIITFYRDCVGIPLHNPEDHPCVFPFIYLGKVHTACTTMEDYLPWCATAVDPNQHMVTNDWGYCTAGCPIETRTCKTVVGGPIVNVFCRFPFRYKGVQYHTCTSVDDPVGPWCATQVDAHGDYMPDFWGRCECPEALNSTASGGRRGLEGPMDNHLERDASIKDEGEQNGKGFNEDSQKSPDEQVFKNPFKSLPFETSTDGMGNTFLVTKQPQYYAGSGPLPVLTTQRPYNATTQYQSITDYPGFLPFTLYQTPATSVRPYSSTTTYGQSYQRTTLSSPVTQTSTLRSDQQPGWQQGSGYLTTQRSYGYETTSEKFPTATTPSSMTTSKLQPSTPWYPTRPTTEALPKSSRGIDYGGWFIPLITTTQPTTTTSTTTLSPIRMMMLRQRRPPTSKDLPPQGTLATYIPSFLNDTVLEEFLFKYGKNLRAFEVPSQA